jgi:hypothetical protein
MDYENTPLWNVVNKSVSELEQNQDIKLSTPREYVIGYICKQIKESLIYKDGFGVKQKSTTLLTSRQLER